MSKINKIKLSGTTYDVEDANASKAVELTQAQYDALVSSGAVDSNTFYIITDAQAVDLSEYWTSGQTQSAIDSAVSGKQDTLSAGTGIDITNNVISATGGGGTVDQTIISGSTNAVAGGAVYNKIDEVEQVTAAGLNALNETLSGKQATLQSGINIKTINNESLLGSGNIDIKGGGVDVVQTTGTSFTDVMSQNAVTAQLNKKQDSSKLPGYIVSDWTYNKNTHKVSVARTLKSNGGTTNITHSVITINNQHIFNNSNVSNLNLVETSAITTSISSSSTDAQVPSAKAVYDALGSAGGEVSSAITSGDTNAVAGGAVYDKFDEVEQVTAAALNNINDKFGSLKLQQITQSDYNNLQTKDPSTLYIIIN